jgi:hypothetical protein
VSVLGFRTPNNSVAPSSVRRAVVNSWRKPTDSDWKSTFDCAACEQPVTRNRAIICSRRKRNPSGGDETKECVWKTGRCWSRNAARIDVGAREMFVAVPPGRDENPVRVFATTDWHECQWLQFLHSVGLLRAAFRPGQDVCAGRTILRHRNELVAAASQHVQHMHKALT